MKKRGQLPSLDKLERLDVMKKEINYNRRRFNSNLHHNRRLNITNITRGSLESRKGHGSTESRH